MLDILLLKKLVGARKEAMAHKLFTRTHISFAERNRITTEEWNIPTIYFLSKIHKSRDPTTNTYPDRPIIGTSGNILKFLDTFFTKLTVPLLPLIPGSLRDTTQLLTELRDLATPLPNDATLFSADVLALYPSIP